MSQGNFTAAMRKAYTSPYEEDDFMNQPVIKALLQAMAEKNMKLVCKWAKIAHSEVACYYTRRPDTTFHNPQAKIGDTRKQELKQIISMASRLNDLKQHTLILHQMYETLEEPHKYKIRRDWITAKAMEDATAQECLLRINNFFTIPE